MNDYLLSLAARSFDRTGDLALVRPRSPSRFEQLPTSWSAEGVVESEGPSDAENAATAAAPGPMRERRQPTGQRQITTAIYAPDEASQGNEDAAAIDHLTVEAEPGRSVHDASAEEGSAAVTAREEPKSEPAIRPASIPPPEAVVKQVQQGAREEHVWRRIHVDVDYRRRGSPASAPGPAAAPEVGKVRYGGPPILHQEEKSNDATSKPRGNRTTSDEPGESATTALLRPEHHGKGNEHRERALVKPAFQLWEEPGLQEPKPKQEPVINVTIGRVEVRAVTQAVHTRERPRKPVPLSLEEYLRRKNGDRR